ncbi:hypothetical protein F5882DRAFT_18318 [Hyaloscypha sp. PMI_1271]|nr:hypothetical protein F5882DRAFT_18318 [Hyaloscypha sp. PMI_1271]
MHRHRSPASKTFSQPLHILFTSALAYFVLQIYSHSTILDILGILSHPRLRVFSSLLISSYQIYWYLIRSSRASLVIKFPITSVFFLK